MKVSEEFGVTMRQVCRDLDELEVEVGGHPLTFS